ncbi:TOBE domain-containing protein, partial [Burkholderia gladioli]
VHLRLPDGQPMVVKVANTRLVELPPVGATAHVIWRRDDCKVLAATAPRATDSTASAQPAAASSSAAPAPAEPGASTLSPSAPPLASGVTR